jgi:hypothetical protein
MLYKANGLYSSKISMTSKAKGKKPEEEFK